MIATVSLAWRTGSIPRRTDARKYRRDSIQPLKMFAVMPIYERVGMTFASISSRNGIATVHTGTQRVPHL